MADDKKALVDIAQGKNVDTENSSDEKRKGEKVGKCKTVFVTSTAGLSTKRTRLSRAAKAAHEKKVNKGAM